MLMTFSTSMGSVNVMVMCFLALSAMSLALIHDDGGVATEHCTPLEHLTPRLDNDPFWCNDSLSGITHQQFRIRIQPLVPGPAGGCVAAKLTSAMQRLMARRCRGAAIPPVSVEHSGFQSLSIVAPTDVMLEALAAMQCNDLSTCKVVVCRRTDPGASVGKPLEQRRRANPQSALRLRRHECLAFSTVHLRAFANDSSSLHIIETLQSAEYTEAGLVLHQEGAEGYLLCCGPFGIEETCGVPPDHLVSLMQHPSITHVDLLAAPVLHMNFSRGLVQSGRQFHEPFGQALGLRGDGYVIGISDTGIDTDHCFFRDNIVPIPYDTYDPRHRKIVRYQAYGGTDSNSRGDFAPGHGTHVAGTLAGSIATTSSNDATAQFHGAAPGAKLSFLDLSGPSAGESIQSRSVTTLAETVVGDGASVMSNSWGGDLAAYTVSCASVDRYIYETKRSLVIFFSAGNEADRNCKDDKALRPLCDRYTVMAPSTAKNLVSVGSSEATVASWEHADLGNYVLTVGGGGESPLTFFLIKGVAGPAFPDPIVGRLALADPADLCRPPSSSAANRGAILLAYRGTCTFSAKTENAIAAGAAGLIIINNIPGHGTVMGCAETTCATYSINSFMISESDGSTVVQLLQSTASSSPSSISLTALAMPDRGPDTLSSFSSHGPTTDLRYKPDVVAVGEMLHSAKSDANLHSNNCDLWASQGTSMSAPLLAGHAVLVQEYLSRIHTPAMSAPSSALVKGLLVQAAKPLTGRYERNFRGDWRTLGETPNFEEGHGTPVLSTVFPVSLNATPTPTPQLFLVDEVEIQQGEAHRYNVTYDGNQAAFQATLCWIDPPGGTSAGARAMLVNNLDLRVLYKSGRERDGDSMRYGNAKTDVEPSIRAASSPDVLNNVEKVRIVGAAQGTFIVEVIASHVATARQRYALVVSGVAQGDQLRPSDASCPTSYVLTVDGRETELPCGGRGSCSSYGICHCHVGWTGASCSTPVSSLSINDTVAVCVEPMSWAVFRLDTPSDAATLQHQMAIEVDNHNPMSDVDIVVCRGRLPTLDILTDTTVPTPSECVAINREQDNNNDGVVPGAPPVVRRLTFTAERGTSYFLGVVGMCCYRANVTVTLVEGLTTASMLRMGADPSAIFASRQTSLPDPVTLNFGCSSSVPQRMVFGITPSALAWERLPTLTLQVRHPRTFELLVNGTCCPSGNDTVCGQWGWCWVCDTLRVASMTSCEGGRESIASVEIRDAVVVLLARNATSPHANPDVISVPASSHYRLRIVQSEDTNSRGSGGDSNDDGSFTLAPSGNAHLQQNFTHTFRFRGKMGNCVPRVNDATTSCRTRNTAVLPNTATGISFYSEDPPILPELALVLDAPDVTVTVSPWLDVPNPQLTLDLLDLASGTVLTGSQAWSMTLDCEGQLDTYTVVCSNITGLGSGKAYRVTSANILHPFPLHDNLLVWVSPTPTISSLSWEPYTHFSNPVTVRYPTLLRRHIPLYVQGTFLLPEIPSSLEGDDDHTDDTREYRNLSALNISFTSISGMFDDIECATSTILTSSLLLCTLDALPTIREGSEFLVAVRSPTWYTSVMGYVRLLLAPRPVITSMVHPVTGALGPSAPFGRDGSVTVTGVSFPSVSGTEILAAALGLKPTPTALLSLGNLSVVPLNEGGEVIGPHIPLDVVHQNETHLVASIPASLYNGQQAPTEVGGSKTPPSVWQLAHAFRMETSFDVDDSLQGGLLVATVQPTEWVRVVGVGLATQGIVEHLQDAVLEPSLSFVPAETPGYLVLGIHGEALSAEMFQVSLSALAPVGLVSSTADPVLESLCILKPVLSNLTAGAIVCRMSPYITANVTHRVSLRFGASAATIPTTVNISPMSLSSVAPSPVAKMSVEGVPLSVGAASYFVMDRAAPTSSMVFVETASDCSLPVRQVGAVSVVKVPPSVDLPSSTTVFSVTPQLAVAQIHPCFSNGTIPPSLTPPSGAEEDLGDTFYIPLDPMLWTVQSVAEITSVTFTPTALPSNGGGAMHMVVEISNSSQELSLPSLTVPMNVTVVISDIHVRLPAALDEDEPPYFVYLGAEVVEAGEQRPADRWYTCNATRVIVFGQADVVSTDLRTHTFQDIRIVGDLVPPSSSAVAVRLCVEFSTSQATPALMPTVHFASILTVGPSSSTTPTTPGLSTLTPIGPPTTTTAVPQPPNACEQHCNPNGGRCTSKSEGRADLCVCSAWFRGSNCTSACPTTTNGDGTYAVCNDAGTCAFDPLEGGASKCTCGTGYTGVSCEDAVLESTYTLRLPSTAISAPSDLLWASPVVLRDHDAALLRVMRGPTASIGLIVARYTSPLLDQSPLCERASIVVRSSDAEVTVGAFSSVFANGTEPTPYWIELPLAVTNFVLRLHFPTLPPTPDNAATRCFIDVSVVPLRVLPGQQATLPWANRVVARNVTETVYICGASGSACTIVYWGIGATAMLLSLMIFVLVVRAKYRISLLEWR